MTLGTEPLGGLHLAIVGAGMMAEAIVAGLVRGGTLAGGAITCADPAAQRLEHVARRYGVRRAGGNHEAVADAQVVVLAVKPAVLPAVAAELRGALATDQLVVSIVAGATTRALREQLGHERCVRAMPNTPAQVGRGITVWCATPAVDGAGIERARAILGSLGREILVTDERQVAMATALSGSGPAYVFLFMEALTDAGVQLGLPRATARELVLETVAGSAAYAAETGAHIAELRDRVTSPGGTTAAALQRFDQGAFRGVVGEAVEAAFRRTLELEADAGG